MKKTATFLLLSLLIINLNAQNKGVLEKGHFLISASAGYQTRGIPVELSVTYGTYDNVFGLPNMKFGLEAMASYNLLAITSSNALMIGVGPTFHYSLFDNFDLSAGFNAGWGLDKFLDQITGTPLRPNYDVDDLLKYFVVVGARYSFQPNIGVFAKFNLGNFNSGTAGFYIKW